MDKSKIKAFAVEARNNLIEGIKDRAYRIGIDANNIKDIEEIQGGFRVHKNKEIFDISPRHREALVKEIKSGGFEEVIEEVAYTWFNRFIALRYLEVNEYLPTGIRIISSEILGKVEPDILSRIGEVTLELKLDSNKVYTLLESSRSDDREKLYKYVLVRQCNELGNTIPYLFEKITDYTELLLPDNLLCEGSILRKMCRDIEEQDWKDGVEIIGWLYQYYISEKKDKVFDDLKKNIKITKENIPAATQLFTPKWITKYLVENSIGNLWYEGHKNEEFKEKLEYYIEEEIQDNETEEILKSIRGHRSNLNPEDITILDPCMGSGHILLYAFDVLYYIYKEAAYPERDIPRKILENNIFGLDIDARATQLGVFSLIMKARGYNRRLFRDLKRMPLILNVSKVEESNGINDESIEYFSNKDENLKKDLISLVDDFRDATEYGSILKVGKVDFNRLEERLEEIEKDSNLIFSDYKIIILNKLPCLIKQGRIMSRKYEVCITNPPYMGIRGTNDILAKYLTENYPASKYDLFSVYMEVCKNYLVENGIYGMINPHSWMFLSSFLELRTKLLEGSTFLNMVHLGSRAFEENVGTIVQNVAFINQNSIIPRYVTRIIDVTKAINSKEKDEKIKLACSGTDKSTIHDICIKKLMTIPSKPFAYWINNNILKLFSKLDKFETIAKPRQGMATSDNKRFLREWYEVEIDKINFMAKDSGVALKSKGKWFPYNKGGEFRKWYGNNRFIINWEDNGAQVKEYATKLYKSYSRTIKNEKFYFESGLTYTFISQDMGARYFPHGFIFDVAGSSIFFNDKSMEKVVLAFLCSKVAKMFLDIMNPTYNIQVGDIKNLPVHNRIFEKNIKLLIDDLAFENIEISKREWDSFETSWDFKIHPLLKEMNNQVVNESVTIKSKFKLWEEENIQYVEKLKTNEEKLNNIFIDIYELNKELTKEVEDKDITLRRADVEREIKSLISFALGCIMGRYSLDVEGLVYGGGKFEDKWDIHGNKVKKVEKNPEGEVISQSWIESRFMPKVDNILPITDDEYFDNDVVSRFIEFLEIAYGKDSLEENLNFITSVLGQKDSETTRQCIRRYFLKDFYKDHLKTYSKKPLYWLFDSGKNHGFKALIYIHRYDESTIAKIRTEYLHPIKRTYESELNRLMSIECSQEYGEREKVLAKKKCDKINKQISELVDYDEIVSHMANRKISFDLDDGIKENYDKLQGINIYKKNGKEEKMNLLHKT